MAAAEKVEIEFRKSEISTHDLKILEDELSSVLVRLSELTQNGDYANGAVYGKEELGSLFDELVILLQESDPSAQDHVIILNKIPEARVLAYQIEEFDFDNALVTLNCLRKILNV